MSFTPNGKPVLCSALLSAVAAAIVNLALSPLVAAEPAMRTWSDSSGKFKIQAKFVSEADGKVTLEQADGKEIEIELKKLSAANQKYVKDQGSSPFKPTTKDQDPFKKKGTTPSAGTTKGGSPAKGAKAAPSEPTEVTPEWSKAKTLLVMPKSKEWNAKPSVFPATISKLATKPLALPPSPNIFDRFDGIRVTPTGHRAILCYINKAPGTDGHTRLVLCDLEKGRVIGSGAIANEWSLLDANDDATRVLVRNNVFGFGKNDQLEIWSLTSSGIEREIHWTAYDNVMGAERDVKWGAFVEGDRVLTMSAGGRLALWDSASATPICWLQTEQGSIPTLSPDRKQCVFSTGKDIAVLDIEQKQVVTSFPTSDLHSPILAFSPDGKKLACSAFNRVYVWNYDTGKLFKEISTVGIHLGSQLQWIDYNNIMVGDHQFHLLDLGLQIPVWQYTGIDGLARTGETCWLVISGSPPALIPAKLPHAAVKDTINKRLMEPDFFVLKSGTVVKINVSGLQDANERAKALQSLTRKVTANGGQVGPAGTIELVATTESGESKELRYMFHGTANFQMHVSRLKFVYQGKTAWESSMSNVPFVIQVKQGEDLSSALKPYEKPNYTYFENVELPKLLIKPPADEKALRGVGSSHVTQRGFQ